MLVMASDIWESRAIAHAPSDHVTSKLRTWSNLTSLPLSVLILDVEGLTTPEVSPVL